jgi:4-hydroxybenzoate polyprenyltransferase
LLLAGLVAWVIHRLTIYAHQDIEDDLLVGLKSTAILFHERTKPPLAAFSVAAVVLIGIAGFLSAAASSSRSALPDLRHLGWQVSRFELGDPRSRCGYSSPIEMLADLFAGLVLDAFVHRAFCRR